MEQKDKDDDKLAKGPFGDWVDTYDELGDLDYLDPEYTALQQDLHLKPEECIDIDMENLPKAWQAKVKSITIKSLGADFINGRYMLRVTFTSHADEIDTSKISAPLHKGVRIGKPWEDDKLFPINFFVVHEMVGVAIHIGPAKPTET